MSDAVLLSVIGPHGGESFEAIIARKRDDIRRSGYCPWVLSGLQVNEFRSSGAGRVLFIEASNSGKGARPTALAAAAREYSADGVVWLPIPVGMSPVTGDVGNSMVKALMLGSLSPGGGRRVDLGNYACLHGGPPRFMLGRSSLLVVPGDTSKHPERMKSSTRALAAEATLEIGRAHV